MTWRSEAGTDTVAKRQTGNLLLAAGLILLVCLLSPLAIAQGVSGAPPSLTLKIPERTRSGPSGSEFARRIASVQGAEREEAIKDEITRGNIPDFLRKLKPVRLSHTLANGLVLAATVFVMPDYLAIGSDEDFFLVPMTLQTALTVAARFGFVLPTRTVVDAIFAQSEVHLTPEPMPAGPQMRSTEYYARHNQTIAQQRVSLGAVLGSLISGHKKDLVVTGRLLRDPSRLAIYGWHRPTGIPIQPLSTVHGAGYVDYSHGVRLVSETVLIEGNPRSFYEVLSDPGLCHLLSDEGTMAGARQIFAAPPPRAATSRRVADY
jgi:hypothetical protein